VWYKDITHDGLKKYRRVTGRDEYEVNQKAEAQMAAWDELWERRQQALAARLARDDKKAQAAAETAQAEEALDEIENTLLAALEIDHRINWEDLKDRCDFGRGAEASGHPPGA